MHRGQQQQQQQQQQKTEIMTKDGEVLKILSHLAHMHEKPTKRYIFIN
jgi:hypothetical protein